MPDFDGASLPPPSGPPLDGPGAPGGHGTHHRPSRWWARRVAGLPVGLWLTTAIAVAAVLAITLSGGGGNDDASGGAAGATSALPTTEAGPVTIPSPSTTTPSPTTVIASTTTVAASTTTTSTTTAATTTVAATTTAAPATTVAPTTVAPATSAPATLDTTVAPAGGRTVTISARWEACRFGPRCLVAGFVISGFDTQPDSFTCEFANGSRFTYSFGVTEVKHACTTGNVSDSITIEVNGVRSATVTTATT